MEKNNIINILKILLISIILEITLFNITSYRTLIGDYKKKEYTLNEIEYSEDDNKVLLEISDINIEVATVKLEISGVTDEVIDYVVAYSDETSSYATRDLPSKTYVASSEKSKYIPCFLSGDVSKIVIKIDSDSYTKYGIDKIVINDKIPLEFNILRVSIVFFIILIFYFMKTSEILNSDYSYKNKNQEKILLITMFAFICITISINIVASRKVEDTYNKGLVDAILSGTVSLLEKPSEELLSLNDPYDVIERNSSVARESYLGDMALYDGNYYVYFGILPVLILFLPYYLITGKYLIYSMAVLIFSILIIIVLKELLVTIYKKWFKDIPFKIVLLSLIILYSGSLILYVNGRAKFYEVAIVSGLYFTLQGISFIFKATEEDNVKYKYIFLGTLFLALAVACRPTQLIASLIILPILIKIFIENVRKKENIIKSIVSIGLPYLVIGISLMWYNYIRFDSVFEFGAKYQLTACNINKLQNRFFTIPMGVLCNLFSIPKIIPDFPFVTVQNDNIIKFYGYYFANGMIGGLFILSPICFFIFYIFKIGKKIKNKKLLIVIRILSITGILLSCLSAMMGGSTQRYLLDYSWMLILVALLIFNVIYVNFKSEEAKKIFIKILGIIACYTFIINIFVGMISEDNYFKKYSPEEYYKTKYTICFWE